MSATPLSIRLVVFDWAGTTIDFGSRAPAVAFRKVFQSEGVEVTDEEARKPMGLNKREHLVAMLSEPDIAGRWQEAKGQSWSDSDVDAMYEQFVTIQLKAIEETSTLVPGILDVASQLRSQGILIAGTTGYFRLAADAVAKAAETQGFVPDVNTCADDVPQGRPAPWMIFRVMSELGVYPPSTVVKVGDTVADIKAGLNAGCWTVGVCDSSSLTGLALKDYEQLTNSERDEQISQAKSVYEDAGAHATISSISELPNLLQRFDNALVSNAKP
ncbi:phosphonoacetaldehyde hydrolase [Thalassoroseus pseudoceratinae]|uniref:phosphonoacetaldehyde hydrolase n=1 Tax=Thalassoroseus pseudoceratinae TaxID=2713176 RepID=UPI001423F67A|nr:phosphonoacetaldehyde hydrolase [Thalassoroseus pseudoceratinae]